jgi:hypothetical protein
MILAITDRRGMRTFTMWVQTEPERTARDFYPHMAQGGACPPTKQHHRVVLFKMAAALEEIAIDPLQHFRDPAVTENVFRILANGLSFGFAFVDC